MTLVLRILQTLREAKSKYRVVRYSKRVPEGYYILDSTGYRSYDPEADYYEPDIKKRVQDNNGDYQYWSALRRPAGWNRDNPIDTGLPAFRTELHGHEEQFYRFFVYDSTVYRYDGRKHFNLEGIDSSDYKNMIKTCESENCRSFCK